MVSTVIKEGPTPTKKLNLTSSIRPLRRLAKLLCATVLISLAGCDDAEEIARLENAEKFIAEGRASGAVVELKRVLQKEPENGKARHLLGQVYLRLGKWDYAEKELLRASVLMPDSHKVSLDLARAWQSQSKPKTLRQNLKFGDNWPPEAKSMAHSLWGASFHAERDFEQAVKAYKTAISLDPSNVQAAVGLTQSYEALQNDKQFRAALAQALELAPSNLLLLSLHAGVAFRDGEMATAEASFREQLELVPNNYRARLGLAQALMAKGNLSAAVKEIEEVLGQVSGHGSARYLRAIIKIRTKDYHAARRDSLLALSALPNHLPSRFLAAVSNFALKRYNDARWHLQALLRHDPENTAGASLLTLTERQIAAAKKRANKAKFKRPLADDLVLFRLADLANRSSSTFLSAYLAAGLQALTKNQNELAIEKLAASYVRKASEEGALALALAHYRADRKQHSLDLLKQRLIRQPGDDRVRLVVANLLLRQGKEKESVLHLEVLLAASPNDVVLLNNLAWAQLRLGKADQAVRLAERAHALAPDYLLAMDTYGMALLKTGKTQRAVEFLTRAVASIDAGPDIRLHYAQALIADGNRSAGISVLEEILAAEEMKSVHRAAKNLLASIE